MYFQAAKLLLFSQISKKKWKNPLYFRIYLLLLPIKVEGYDKSSNTKTV